MEVDSFFLGETGRVSLGPTYIQLSKEQLFEAPQREDEAQLRLRLSASAGLSCPRPCPAWRANPAAISR